MATHSSILAWRLPMDSLAGYYPQGHKGLNTNEVTDLTCLSSICCPIDRQVGGYGALEDCGFLWERTAHRLMINSITGSVCDLSAPVLWSATWALTKELPK